jgi:hypothetical protein
MTAYILLSVLETILFALIGFTKASFKNLFLILESLLVFVVLFIVNYNAMPVLQVWGYEGVWLETFMVSLAGVGAYALALSLENNECPKSEKKHFSHLRWIPAGIPVLVAVVAFFQSAEISNAGKYAQRLKVEVVSDQDFKNDISPIDVDKVISVDESWAQKVAQDVLGENTALGSKVEVGKMTLQQVTGSFTINGGKLLSFENQPIWVAPLEHTNVLKCFLNGTTPGYVLVDATNANNRYLVTEVNGKSLALAYIESACLSMDLERHIRTSGYVSKGLNDHSFEIDPNGHPHWVLTSYRQTIGFCGEETDGVITVDAQNGDVKAYGIDEAPEWIDRIQPEDFVKEQIRQWGEYQNGYWNSTCFSKQEGVIVPTEGESRRYSNRNDIDEGVSLVFANGRSYWYTGMKSVSSDQATNGFILVDTKTKAARFYKASGFNETEAQKIAEGQSEAAAAGYYASVPVLYNVHGIPTYIMTYKDKSDNMQGYCILSSTSRTAVGCDKSKAVAVQKYLSTLRAMKRDTLKDGKVVTVELEGTIRAIVLEGDTYYLLLNEKKGVELTGKTVTFPELKWSKKGDAVKVSFKIGDEKVGPMDSFDNVNFEI